MASDNEPAKSLLPYLQRADELQKHELLVAYYCRLYAMERGLKIPQNERTKTTNSLLISIMNQLEKDKKTLKLGSEDNFYLEGFALNVFGKADKQDRAGKADLNTAKTFYAASIFFEILNQFGPLQPDLEQKQKYAVWKAADIRKALKEGRKPMPGPPSGDDDLTVPSSETNGAYDIQPSESAAVNPSADSDPAPQLYDSINRQHSTDIPSSYQYPDKMDQPPSISQSFQYQAIINHAEVSIAFVQENKIPAILSCLPKCSTHLKTIVSFGNVSSIQKNEAEEWGVSCFSWEMFCQLGKLRCELPPKQRKDICTIMYTSGTTGEPKGVILSNEAMMAEVLSIDQMLLLTDTVVTEEDSYFSFLPLAHVYDQIMENFCIYKGSSIGFWRGDIRFLMDDIQELKPTIFSGVPRVYDRIYTGINSKVSSGGLLQKTLFQYAYNYKLANMEKGFPQDKATPFFDTLVFSKIKQVLGGRVRILLSGAAPLPRHVEEFLRVTSCSNLTQGYGLTESCGGCLTSIANVHSMIGTVGVPMTTIEARLESVPEMGYDALSSVPRGEICLRGSTLFSGYHKREDLTKDVLVDGWFHTGDIGELQPDGAMKIIDRKKNIFKLSQGEYVAVENIESKYLQCPLISAIWVYGNSFESFLVAVVVPDRTALENWAVQNSIADNFTSLCQNPKARKYILEELYSTGQKQQLRGFEMLKAVHLEPNPFDMGRDMITPTYKLKRPQLLEHYKDCVDKLYSEAKGTRV